MTLDPDEVRSALGVASVDHVFDGGQGSVWRYHDGTRDMAAKILIGSVLVDTDRVEREIEAYARVESPYVVDFYRMDRLQIGGTERMVLHFGFVEGDNVAHRRDAGSWPSADDATAFAVGMLRGLVAIHEAGVIHRDIKPENVILRRGDWGSPVITDLGIVKVLGEPTLTPQGAIYGTLPYMPPEVLDGRPVRKVADLWSLGVILWELTERTHPYGAPDSLADARTAIAAMTPSAPPGADANLGLLVRRFLSARPTDRGSSRRALEEVES